MHIYICVEFIFQEYLLFLKYLPGYSKLAKNLSRWIPPFAYTLTNSTSKLTTLQCCEVNIGLMQCSAVVWIKSKKKPVEHKGGEGKFTETLIFVSFDTRFNALMQFVSSKHITLSQNKSFIFTSSLLEETSQECETALTSHYLNSLFGLCLFDFFLFLFLFLFVFLSFCLFVFLSFHLFVFSSFRLFVFCLFVFLSFSLFVLCLIKCLKGLKSQKSLFVSKFESGGE